MAKQVFSTQVEQPSSLEFGKDTVYVRDNIRRVEVENQNETTEMWAYNETEYTYQEYVQIQQQDNESMMLALVELAELIGG
jgi:hypothetical protein